MIRRGSLGALEQRFPEPPLYPPDETARRRALELEDCFDEQLGPGLRAALAAVHDHPQFPQALLA